MSPQPQIGIFVFLTLVIAFGPLSGALATTATTNLGPESKEVAEVSNTPGRALESEQADWLAHATTSCTMWRQANLYDAIREAKEACRLAPGNKDVLLNLGLMLQATDGYDAAMACYERAGKIDPNHYLPQLGMARCWIMKGDEEKGVKILKEMSIKSDGNFDWYYVAGQTCLKIKQNDLAENLFKSAVKVATSADELAIARNALFLAALRGNKLEQVRILYKKVFAENAPSNAEVYVRAGVAVLTADDFVKGQELLENAIKNLKSAQDTEAFFQLGRIFQEKASEAALKSGKNRWLESARKAYTQAIDRSPKVAHYFLARADVLLQEEKLSEMIADLKVAKSLSQADPLPSFVLDNLIDENSTNGIRIKKTKLVTAKISIVGLSCDCHLSKLLGTMRNINGVVFISASGRKVFTGEVIYAPSIISIDDLKTKTQTEFFKSMPPMKADNPFNIEVLAEAPIHSLPDVFKHACETRHGPILSYHESFVDYYNRFNDIQPSIPKSLSAEKQ